MDVKIRKTMFPETRDLGARFRRTLFKSENALWRPRNQRSGDADNLGNAEWG
jgi:hypothetical protein